VRPLLRRRAWNRTIGTIVSCPCPRLPGPGLWAAILLSLGVGLVAGTLNGLASVVLGIPSFIVTLGMLEIARGLAYLATQSQTKYIGSAVESLSAPIAGLAVSPAFLMAGLVVVAGQVVLSRTVFGRYIGRDWHE